jgi:hypothetical protein
MIEIASLVLPDISITRLEKWRTVISCLQMLIISSTFSLPSFKSFKGQTFPDPRLQKPRDTFLHYSRGSTVLKCKPWIETFF